MLNARSAACLFYGLGTVLVAVDAHLFSESTPRASETSRSHDRSGAPRLDPYDGFVNRSVLTDALSSVPAHCDAPARSLAVEVSGRSSWVRFAPRLVCQLRELKRISVAQPGMGEHGVAEVGAFILGRRLGAGKDVDVSRVVVPPFTFARDRLDFVPADLGPLEPGERLIGTYHTHPDGDLEEGLLSTVDLRYLRSGGVSFHGAVGRFAEHHEGNDLLFHIVDPREGGWNIYAHDGDTMGRLLDECDAHHCRLNDLRIAGSRYYLNTRYYEGSGDFWEPPQ